MSTTLGRYAFLVTNQAGVAKGHFTEADVHAFHAHMQRHLRAVGAHFDDIRYCPDHPDGSVARYNRISDWRKPTPGMLLDLMRVWPIVREASLMVGNKESDVRSAEAAGVRGLVYRWATSTGSSRHTLMPRMRLVAARRRDCVSDDSSFGIDLHALSRRCRCEHLVRPSRRNRRSAAETNERASTVGRWHNKCYLTVATPRLRELWDSGNCARLATGVVMSRFNSKLRRTYSEQTMARIQGINSDATTNSNRHEPERRHFI